MVLVDLVLLAVFPMDCTLTIYMRWIALCGGLTSGRCSLYIVWLAHWLSFASSWVMVKHMEKLRIPSECYFLLHFLYWYSMISFYVFYFDYNVIHLLLWNYVYRPLAVWMCYDGWRCSSLSMNFSLSAYILIVGLLPDIRKNRSVRK